MEMLFEAKDIVKQYAQHKALDKVSIAVPKGKIFGLLGPNGAGKTSLIRIINQITAPDEGTLFFDGEPLSSKHISQIGYLPEERGLYKKMGVGEQAMYLARLKGLSSAEAKEKLKYWFKRFEIAQWWDKKIEELSKGMAQKVQFIVTILHNPKLLIFDEPFSGFDPINANIIKEEILKLKEDGATIIFSTHNMESVEELCDHIALINQSKKILDGPLDQIKQEYKQGVFSVKSMSELPVDLSLPAQFSILDKEENKARISIADSYTGNDLIQALLPQMQIQSFEEELPSANDIFIQAVNQAKA